MKLKNASKALVPPYKITDYLLSPTHPSGRHKASFFLAFGFEAGNWRVLARALRKLAASTDVQKVEASPFGLRYTIEGKLEAPDGRRPWVRTVWFIEAGRENPRLVTAYPLSRRNG
jgi:hypothetical protein